MKSLTKTFKVLSLGLITLLTKSAFAVPTLYPQDITLISSIQNNTDSKIIMDDVDPRKVYVLPPKTAEAVSQGLHTETTSLQFCPQMRKLTTFSDKITDRLKVLTDEEAKQATQVIAAQKAVGEAKLAATQFATQNNLMEISSIDDAIANAIARLNELSAQLQKCTKDCSVLLKEAKSLMAEKNKMSTERTKMITESGKNGREYVKLQQKAMVMDQNLQDQMAIFDRLRSNVTKANEEILKLYNAYGAMEGGRVAISYKGNWSENLAQLRKDNAGFSFEQIETKNAVAFASLLGNVGLPSEGAIMEYEMDGERQKGSVKLTSYPQSLNANLRMSLIGACPLAFPKLFATERTGELPKLRYGLTVTYQYMSSFNLKVTVSYNMHRMYQKIVSSGSSGGFFSTRNWTAVEERNFFSDSFKVDWKVQDASNTIPEEERQNVEQDLRRQILLRVATLSLPGAPNRDAILSVAQPGPRGGVVLADSITKVCPQNVYCQGAGAILKVLDAIFGSSSTSSSYTLIENKDLTETWSRDVMTANDWITVYNP